MGYSSAGVYTPPVGAQNAFAGKIIASADWNNIFTDIATALTQLAQYQVIQTPRSVSTPGDISIALVDTYVLIGASVPNINLPASASKPSPVTIIGNAAGIFSAHNSVVLPNGAELIDGLANVTLASDYQVLILLPLSTGGWRAIL